MRKKELEQYTIDNTINYLKLNYYIFHIYSNFNFVKKIAKNDYNELCQQLITLKLKNIPYIKFYYDQYFFKKNNIINYENLFIIDNINFGKNEKNLIITNLLEINYQLQDKYNFDTQLFQHEEMRNSVYELGLKKLLNPYVYYSENNLKKLIDNKERKYNNILLKLNDFLFEKYYNYFLLTKIPNIMLLITSGLQQIKKGGTIYLFLRNGIINSSISKLMYLMCGCFKNYEIHNVENNLVYYIEFKCFKDNLSEELIEKMREICLNIRPHNYSLCQFTQYYYHLLTTKSDKALGYELNLDEIGISKKYKVLQTNMSIIDDIDINPVITKDGEMLVYMMEKMYNDFDEMNRYNILRNVHYKNDDNYNSIYVDKDLVDKVFYENTMRLVKFFKENKIAYNKTYLAYINKYNTNQFKKLYSLDNIIKMKIINYNLKKETKKKSKKGSKKNSHKKNISKKKGENIIKKINTYKGYNYDELNETQDLTYLSWKVKDEFLFQSKTKKLPTIIKKTTEDFARGVSQYINNNYNVNVVVSNAFMKLWEIYSTISKIIPYKNKINAFHFCEAPGNWINCTSKFIISKRLKTEEYNWYANTLNPKNPSNIKQFGKDIFKDDYGFMKKYPEKWLYGKDNTGDITKSKNLRWLRKFFIDKPKLDVVTGDGGIGGNLKQLQKLEYGQMCAALATCGIGGSCVVKHFLPYVSDLPESENANGFFMNFLYIYYLYFKEIYLIKPLSSSPNSSEFYLVGLKFKGIEENEFEKIIKQLDDFKINQCFFKKEEIPYDFSNQVIMFIEKLSELNIEQYEIINTLLTCFYNKDKTIEKITGCNNYLDINYIQKIQEPRFREWIKMYAFQI